MEKIKNIDMNQLRKLIETNLRYVNYLDSELQFKAVQNISIHLIRYIENPSEEIQIYAIENGVSIRLINNLTEKAKYRAVIKDPVYIKYIENPSNKLVFTALGRDIYSIYYIQNPTLEMKLYFIENFDGEISDCDYKATDIPYDNIVELAEKDKGNLLLIDLDETIQNILYEKYGENIIYYIREPHPSLVVKCLNHGYRGDIIFNKYNYNMLDFIIQCFNELNDEAKEYVLGDECITVELLNILPQYKMVKKEIMKRKLGNK